MITKNDVQEAIKFAKENPEEAKRILAQATALTASAMIFGVMVVKAATLIVNKK